jgi:hypothetical protein
MNREQGSALLEARQRVVSFGDGTGGSSFDSEATGCSIGGQMVTVGTGDGGPERNLLELSPRRSQLVRQRLGRDPADPHRRAGSQEKGRL